MQTSDAERTVVPHSRPFDVHGGGRGRSGEHPRPLVRQRDPDNLQRALRGSYEQICRFNPGDPHLLIVTRSRR